VAELDDAGNRDYSITMFEDITDRKLAEQSRLEQAKLNEHQALHDALTGLANRRKLYVDVAERLGTATPFVLAIFDLDGFKLYNDTFGHPAGDALLAQLGARLGARLAGDATAYRMGGDEFCIVGGTENADAMIETARDALCERGEAFSIGCSYGKARVPEEATTLERALHLADQRLYVQKRATKVGDTIQVA
jgi:two-component system cell cycle response regulator